MDADFSRRRTVPTALKTLTGRVVVDKTNVGIPNLLVTAYDVDRNTIPDRATAQPGAGLPRDSWSGLEGERIGDVTTDDDGNFTVHYAGETPNLVLSVAAPTGEGSGAASSVLHVCCAPDAESGTVSDPHIRLTPRDLEAANVPIPRGPGPSDSPAENPKAPPTDPPTDRPDGSVSERVMTVATVLNAERDEATSIRAVLSHEVGNRAAEEERIRGVVNGILANLAGQGGDVRWKVRGATTIAQLTESAVTDARSTLASSPPSVRVRPGYLDEGESLSTRELITRLSGVPPSRDGYRRANPLERMRMRERHATADGLPRPNSPVAANGNRSPEPAGRADADLADGITSSVHGKVRDLVEALRLPEDPPLLVADSAINGPGAEVELARGIADVTAFHDVHELVIAMPSVWQEVFDARFVSVLEASVRSLAAAGLPIDDLAEASQGHNRPAARLLTRFKELELTYRTTSARQLRPAIAMMLTTPTAIGDAVTDPRGMVLRRSADSGGTGARDHFDASGALDLDPSKYQEAARDETQNAGSGVSGLLGELESYLSGKHSFTVFAADGPQRAINFGLLLTWREFWTPLTYQAGEIVHTMTLAPGEERTITMKRRRSRKRSDAETRKAQNKRTLDTTDTNRAESEILRKATATTNFHLNTSGETDLLVSGGSFTSTATRDVGRDNSDTRRRFREAVMKAAQEYQEESSWEVKTEVEDVAEEESTTRFRNPNDEVVLNAVFYSLQRRYRVHEHLHRARPVVMVARPMPDPAEITTAWLIRHAWVLRRCLLDDRFKIALDYLTTSFLGDKEVLANLKASVVEHTKVLKEARYRLAEARALVEMRGLTLAEVRRQVAGGNSNTVFDLLAKTRDAIPGLNLAHDALTFAGNIFGGDDDDKRERRAAALVEAAEDEAIRAEREAREAEIQVTAATSALQQATRDYVAAKRDSLNREVQIAELRVHVLDEISLYCERIWELQPPAQRFFELHNIQIPVLDGSVRVTREGTFDQPGVGGFTPERFRAEFVGEGGPLTFRPLAEIAHLDQYLGNLGNFAIFPMKEGNALTDLILAPYLDQDEVLRDPQDIAASWTMSELREYADRLRAQVVAGEITQEEFDQVHAPFLRSTLERLLTEPQPSEELVVAPANAVFAELLTSGPSLVEPFKKEHRALDVAKVRAEVRAMELENARRAALIAAGRLEDPEIDKQIVVQGEPSVFVPAEAS